MSSKKEQGINEGNGINNMKKRAEAIGAKIQIEEVNPTGTRLSIVLSLNEEK